MIMTEGNLEAKLPTMWTDEKQRWEESEKRREEKKKETQRRESQKKENADAQKGMEVAKLCFSSDLWRVQSHLARWEMKSCTPVWCEAHVQVKVCKAPQFRSTFRS